MVLESENSDVMSRLILIGNGFDLAHGFKTSYKNFILNYFKKAIEAFLNQNTDYNDELFHLSYHGNVSFNENPEVDISNFNQVKEKIDFLNRSKWCNVKFHSRLFKKLYDNLNELNWVDIENDYFEILNSYVKKPESIIKLNNEFNYLRVRLESYLDELNLHQFNFHHAPYSELFSEKIKSGDLVTVKLKNDINPELLYFLNFNYTSTFEYYFGQTQIHLNNLLIHYNYIHGELGNNKNPPIFGFGDELDKNYLEFENLKNNELFTHIKSFKYSQTENYHNLIRFVESNDFQVYIIGHSCGISDRTMLNQIFEHDNCKSIKIFYHKKRDGTDDFTEKSYEISRHFKNKGLMRKKLVPKSKSRQMPKPRKLE